MCMQPTIDGKMSAYILATIVESKQWMVHKAVHTLIVRICVCVSVTFVFNSGVKANNWARNWNAWQRWCAFSKRQKTQPKQKSCEINSKSKREDVAKDKSIGHCIQSAYCRMPQVERIELFARRIHSFAWTSRKCSYRKLWSKGIPFMTAKGMKNIQKKSA